MYILLGHIDGPEPFKFILFGRWPQNIVLYGVFAYLASAVTNKYLCPPSPGGLPARLAPRFFLGVFCPRRGLRPPKHLAKINIEYRSEVPLVGPSRLQTEILACGKPGRQDTWTGG